MASARGLAGGVSLASAVFRFSVEAFPRRCSLRLEVARGGRLVPPPGGVAKETSPSPSVERLRGGPAAPSANGRLGWAVGGSGPRPFRTAPAHQARPSASTITTIKASTNGQNSRCQRRGQNDGIGRVPSPLRRHSSLALRPSQASSATPSSPNRFQGGA